MMEAHSNNDSEWLCILFHYFSVLFIIVVFSIIVILVFLA